MKMERMKQKVFMLLSSRSSKRYVIALTTIELYKMNTQFDCNCHVLLQIGDPIEARYKESTERGPAIDQLTYCINSYRGAALSNDPQFDHIEIAEKQKVRACASCDDIILSVDTPQSPLEQ